jgi:hypothetical protein
VIQGEVRLAGATLYPSETIEWVHAPHCHAIPVLRTVEETRLELHPDNNARGIRQLGRLSPLFRKIWNEPSETNSAKTSKDATFEIVSFHVFSAISYSYSLRYIPLKMLLRNASSRNWSHHLRGTRSCPHL